MTPLDAGAVFAAGTAAGAINAIVGSGSLLTFPTLLAVGYKPVLANVSNSVGLTFGSVSGAVGYRVELKGQLRRCLMFGACTAVGSLTGAILLLALPGKVFEHVVPFLVLFGCALVAVQPVLARRLANVHPHNRIAAGAVAVGLTGVYGGYFGAAQGVILMGVLGLVLDDDLQRLNGLKNVLAALANGVAALLFVIVSHVAWAPAALIAAGSIVGGVLGARYGRRIPPQALRWTIVVVGTVVAVILLIRG
jgi:uncharacterized protein